MEKRTTEDNMLEKRLNSITEKRLFTLEKRAEQMKDKIESVLERRTDIADSKMKTFQPPRIDPLNLPYRPKLVIPKEKVEELFNKINNMDTQELKQFAVIHSINLNLEDPNTGDNLIHKVITSNNNLKKEFNRLNVIKFLVQNGVNPDKPNKENQTPIHLACKEQYETIVDYLISINVDLNFVDNYGMSPLHYALQGRIELFKEIKAPGEFISKPKKISIEKNKKIIVIKQKIWETLKDNSFLNLLGKPINQSFYNDKKINKLLIDLNKKISIDSIEPKIIDKNKFYKENIEIIRSEIESSIKKKWSNFADLNELEIHEKNDISFKIDDNNFSPLKINDVKQAIKNLSKTSISNIKEICNSITYTDVDMNKEYEKIIKKFYSDFFNENRDKFSAVRSRPRVGAVGPTKTQYILNDSIKNTTWDTYNKKLFSSNAVDNADNIIDFENLTFLGGSREIDIHNDFNNIVNILSYDSLEKKVFHILCDDLLCNPTNPIKTINNFNPTDLDNATDNGGNLILQFGTINEKLNSDMIKLAFNVIFNQKIEIPNDINKADELIRQKFFDKWSKLFTKNSKGKVLYTMYGAYACLNSIDNLSGMLNDSILILSSALKRNGNISEELLSSSMKKIYISKITEEPGKSIEEISIGILNVLLEKNLNVNYLTYFDDTINPEITQKLNLLIAETDTYKRDIIVSDTITTILNKIKNENTFVEEADLLGFFTFLSNGTSIDDLPFFIINQPFQTIVNIFGGKNIKNFESGDNKEIINKFIYLIRKRQVSSFFPYIYHMLELFNCTAPNPYENFSLKKLQESRYLGLYYMGLIPFSSKIVRVNQNDNSEINLLPRTVSHAFTNGELNGNLTPFIGNFVDTMNNLQVLDKLNYYECERIKYRPPLREAIHLAGNRNKNYLLRILKTILSDSSYGYNLYSMIESNKNISKTFTKIYPTIIILAEILEYIGASVKDNIEKIIKELNKINSLILIFYYLFSPDKLMKIPKFNYYELPLLSNKSNFLYFDSPTNELSENLTNVVDTESIIPDEKNEYSIVNKGISNYRDLFRNLSDGFIKGIYIIKKEDLVASKEKILPPSISSSLDDLYKFNLMFVITEYYNKLKNNEIDDIKVLIKQIILEQEIIENDVQVYFILGKIIQEIFKERMNYYVSQQTIDLLNRIIDKNFPMISLDIGLKIKPIDYEIYLNKTNIEIDELENKLFIPRIERNIIRENIKEFILYPEEYSNSDILRSKYVLKVNKKIYENLLNNEINPFLLDNNNQTPIFPVLKLHFDEIIYDLKKRIDYREYSDLDVFAFLKEEFNNHTSKLIGSDMQFKKWIENFISYQKNEVLNLIFANEKYKNNIPIYLEESFNVVFYIISQYISESIYKLEDINLLNEIKENLNIDDKNLKDNNYGKYLFLNEIISDLPNVFTTKKSNYYYDKKLIIQKEIKLLEKKLSKLVSGNTKKTTEKIIEVRKKQSEDLEKKIIFDKNYKKDINNNDIIERYNSLLLDDPVLSRALSEMVNLDSNLEKSFDLLTLKINKAEKIIVNDILQKNESSVELSLLKNLNDFYNHTNNICEIYMTYGKFTNSNYILSFVKKLLIFCTKHFLMVPYIEYLKIMLFEHFKNVYQMSDDDILSRVDFCFDYTLTYNNKLNNIDTILKDVISKKLVENSVNIFDDSYQEDEFTSQSQKEILDSITNLFIINPIIPIPEDATVFKNIAELNMFYDTFINRTINNWFVIIENVLKFNINQGRIIKSLYNLFRPIED